MVIKIVRCSNLPAILGYNFAKQARHVAYIIDSQFMPKCEETPPSECQRIIGLWGSRNATCDKRFVHINVNPAPQDWQSGVMSEEKLKQICREYLEAMGFGDQPYVVLIHKDKSPDRWHAHIVTTCIRLDGTRISDNLERRRSMKVVRDMEKKYGLWNATQKREVKAMEVKRINYNDGEVKRKIGDLVEFVRSYDYQSLDQFRAVLNVYGVSVRLVNHYQGGKLRAGLVYFCIDDSGRQVGKCFRANQLHKCGIKDTIGSLDTVYIPKPFPQWLDGALQSDNPVERLHQYGVVPVVGCDGVTFLVSTVDRQVYEIRDGYQFARRFSGYEYESDNLEESLDGLTGAVNDIVACFMIGSIAVTDSETPEEKRKRKRRNRSV